MPSNYVLDIDKLEGESKIESGYIDVLSWNWGAENQGTWHEHGGGGAGKGHVHDLTFTKFVDSATPNIMLFCCTGEHLGKATLTCKKSGGKDVDFLEIEMEKVIITSVQTGGSDATDARPRETVSLNFAKYTIKYVPQEDSGSGGGSVEATFNIEENKQE